MRQLLNIKISFRCIFFAGFERRFDAPGIANSILLYAPIVLPSMITSPLIPKCYFLAYVDELGVSRDDYRRIRRGRMRYCRRVNNMPKMMREERHSPAISTTTMLEFIAKTPAPGAAFRARGRPCD